jgi:hypothetical protein
MRRLVGVPLACALGLAAPASADPIDLTLYRSGETYLRPTAELEWAIFSESNAWHGQSRTVIGDHVGYWWEYAITGGLEGALEFGGAGLAFGRVSAVGAGSQGLDAAGSDFDDRYPERLELEDAYLGWRAGAFELSVGKQRYQIGNGFFMWDGATDGGERGAFWIAPRKAFYASAIARYAAEPFRFELFYVKPNDDPFTSTDVVGGNFEYTAGETGTFGVSYLKIVDSEIGSRDGLDFFDWRVALTPLPSDRSFQLNGELALELNASEDHSHSWYGEAGYAFDETAWTPFVSWRCSWFGGDDPQTRDHETWDPLFYGFEDWSTWYVGEIIGNFVALNRDLVMQTARLRVSPVDALTLSFIYNYYRLNQPVTEIAAHDLNPRAANIRRKHLGQSFDLIADWSATENLSFTGVAAALDPGAGMQQYVEARSGKWWLHFMLYAKLAF